MLFLLKFLLTFFIINPSITSDLIVTKNNEDDTKYSFQINKYNQLISGLKNKEFKKITFIVGAGISTSAGIPDFRSKTGIFEIMQKKHNLREPTDFFEIGLFQVMPQLFYDFQKDFFGNQTHYPTFFHYFMGFLDSKNMVKYVMTQNIDALELDAGIRKEKIVFAHGNFKSASCSGCYTQFDINLYNEHVNKGEVLYCKCGSPVKADIVFYGEPMSYEFFQKGNDINDVDLAIIAGTGLEVSPFNELAFDKLRKETKRIFINRTSMRYKYGYRDFNFKDVDSRDLLLLGSCDEIIQKIIDDVGWTQEFNDFIQNVKKQNNK